MSVGNVLLVPPAKRQIHSEYLDLQNTSVQTQKTANTISSKFSLQIMEL